MRKLVIIFGLCAISTFTQATIRYVRPSSYGFGNGSSWANASNDLQLMIDQSNSGDEVWVAAGVVLKPYVPDKVSNDLDPNNTNATTKDRAFCLRKNVKVYGGFVGNETNRDARDWVANPTILSGNNYAFRHVVISAGDVGTACLDGFTIVEGYAWGTGPISVNGESIYVNCGGGIVIQNSSPLLENLDIHDNISNYGGGGIYCKNSFPVLDNVKIFDNTAMSGGGVCLEDCHYSTTWAMSWTNTEIYGNTAQNGGGIYVGSNSEFELYGIVIRGNKAKIMSGSLASGGGIYISGNQHFKLCNSIVKDNKPADNGGGIYMENNDLCHLLNVLIIGNKANNNGGAVYVNGGADNRLINVTICDNTDNISCQGVHCNGNSGVKVHNSILYGNTSTSSPYTNMNIEYSLIQNQFPAGAGNLNGSIYPDFVNYAGKDYRIGKNSPCINAGLNNLIGGKVNRLDLAENPRKIGDTVDMGAYEHQGIRPNSAGVLFVKKGGSGTHDGMCWADAYDELDTTLYVATLPLPYNSYARSIQEIWVADGVYNPATTNGFILPENVKIYGGFPFSANDITHTSINSRPIGHNNFGGTILNANGAYHTVVAVGNTHLDGFLIRGGSANNYSYDIIKGVWVPRYYGGGICMSGNANLQNLEIYENSGLYGGGVAAMWGNYCPRLENIRIHDNHAAQGGGLYCNQASLYAKYIHIFDNEASQGGGIYCYGSSADGTDIPIMPIFENISIHHNKAYTEGGGIYNSSVPLFLNALVYDNDVVGDEDDADGSNISGATIYNSSYPNSKIIFVHATITRTTMPISPLEIVAGGGFYADKSIICLNGFTPPAGNYGNSGGCSSIFTNAANGDFSLNAAGGTLLTNPTNLWNIVINLAFDNYHARLCDYNFADFNTDITDDIRPNPNHNNGMVNYGAYEHDPYNTASNFNHQKPWKSMDNNENEDNQNQEPIPLSEKVAEWNLQVYPNPTTGQLTINSEQLTISSVEIYDVVGQKVPFNSPEGGKYSPPSEGLGEATITIDVFHLANGMYFLKIQTENGIVMKKFVKN